MDGFKRLGKLRKSALKEVKKCEGQNRRHWCTSERATGW